MNRITLPEKLFRGDMPCVDVDGYGECAFAPIHPSTVVLPTNEKASRPRYAIVWVNTALHEVSVASGLSLVDTMVRRQIRTEVIR